MTDGVVSSEPEIKPSVPCPQCRMTGFADKVYRGAFTMNPSEKICPDCHGRGWLAAQWLE